MPVARRCLCWNGESIPAAFTLHSFLNTPFLNLLSSSSSSFTYVIPPAFIPLSFHLLTLIYLPHISLLNHLLHISSLLIYLPLISSILIYLLPISSLLIYPLYISSFSLSFPLSIYVSFLPFRLRLPFLHLFSHLCLLTCSFPPLPFRAPSMSFHFHLQFLRLFALLHPSFPSQSPSAMFLFSSSVSFLLHLPFILHLESFAPHCNHRLAFTPYWLLPSPFHRHNSWVVLSFLCFLSYSLSFCDSSLTKPSLAEHPLFSLHLFKTLSLVSLLIASTSHRKHKPY